MDVLALFSGAGTALVTGIIGYFSGRIGQKGSSKETSVSFKYFSTPGGDEFNEPFYKHFIGKLNEAKRQIYVSGEGFGEWSARIAHDYNDAVKSALRRNVHVVRVQTSRDTSQTWANLLEGLVREFPETFELFLLRDPSSTDMISMCVVDPELESCVVELMINSRTMFGSKPANIAGAGIFIERNQKLARDLRDRLLELRRDKLTFRVSSPESVREYLVPTVLYFAYGSNMSARQMSARLPSAQKIGTGFIEGYKLAFNRKGSYRSGGVASIVSQPQSRVYGVIWSIPKAEMARLDTIEDPLAYKPIFVEVQPEKGNSFQCHAYQAIPQGDFKPDAEYHSLVIEAAKEAGLPADYIEALEALGLSS